MSAIDNAAIRARLAAATPGPWGFDTSGVFHDESCGPILDKNEHRKGTVVGIGMVGDPYPRGDNHPSENMEFIAHARTDVGALLDQCEALARYIVRQERGLPDHACKQCMDERGLVSELIIEGFQCTYHVAVAIDCALRGSDDR